MKRHNVILESNVEPKDNNVLWLQGNKLKKFGNTGWENIVEGDVVTTDRIENGAVTTDKIATSAFDDTLTKQNKIAPANIVGNKITMLDEKVDALALGKFYGYFPDSTSFPADASIPGYAYVRLDNSYKIWNFSGESWSDSEVSIDENDVIITTDRIEDGAVTSKKIATSTFDSTLSVSGKIAPANIVGEKLTELKGKIVNVIGGDADLTFEEVGGKFYGLDGNLYDSANHQYADIDITNYAGGKLTLSITDKVSGSSACSGIYKDGAFVNRVRESEYTDAATWDIPENAVLKVSHNKQSSVNVSILVNGELVELKERVKSLEDSSEDNVHYNDEIKKEVVIVDTLYDKDGNVATKDNITTTTGCYLTLNNGNVKLGGAALAVSDFADISQFTSFNIKGFYSAYTSTVAIVCFYDENKSYLNEYICQKIYPSDTLEVQVPNGAKYARFCSGISANFDGITNAIVKYSNSKTIRDIFDSLDNDELRKDIEGLKQETSELRSAVDGINLSDGSNYSKNSDNTVLYNQLLNPVKETMGLTAMINSWGFIGDSLSSGCIIYNISAGYKAELCYENSFGQKICSQCGSFGVNYSFNGATTKKWWDGFVSTTNKKGWKKGEGDVVEFGTIKHQAYIIGLGTNDINAGMAEGNVNTDINADYNQNADTFVGNYAKIIQKIRESNEHAPIFCLIQPNGVMRTEFDNAIRAIVNHFDGVFLIDTRADLSAVGITILSSDPYVYRGHWTTQGYQWMAYVLANEIDHIIRNNREYFDRVALIGTPADNGSIIW